MQLQKTGLTCGISKGYTLLEISLVLALIALVLVGARSIPFTSYARERAQCIDALNVLSSATYEQALATGVIHRLVINTREQGAYAQKKESEDSYARVREIPAVFIPEGIALVDVVIDGRTESKGDERVYEVWIDMYPTGSAQELSFGLYDERDASISTYDLNPFTAQFAPR